MCVYVYIYNPYILAPRARLALPRRSADELPLRERTAGSEHVILIVILAMIILIITK